MSERHDATPTTGRFRSWRWERAYCLRRRDEHVARQRQRFIARQTGRPLRRQRRAA